MKKIIKKYDSFIFENASATHLALARISVAIFCFFFLSHDSHPEYPNSEFYNSWTPNSIFIFFPSDVSVETISTIRSIFKWSLVLMALGLGTRIMTLIAFLSGFFVHGYLTCFSDEVYHHSQMAIFAIFILSLGRVNDSLSLDRLIFKKRLINPKLSPYYGYPVKFLWIWIVSVYFTAGLQKLYKGDGLKWALSQNLRLKLMNTPNVTDLGMELIKQPDFVIYTFGLIGLAVQVLSPVTLFYRKSLLLVIPLWISFHFFVRMTFGGHFSFFSQIGCYLAILPYLIYSIKNERPVEA